MSHAPGGEPSFLSPRVLVPFALITLIWGSTWLVIVDQVRAVPPSWSACYRFVIAGVAMAAFAWWRGDGLRLDARGMRLAALLGIAQFALNFAFVYRAEQYITSGLVAVLFALLIVPNALFGRLFLKRAIGVRFFAGSAVAAVGVALLIVHEYRAAPVGPEAVMLGTLLTLCGIASASAANIPQATRAVQTYPITTMLAWAMLIGAAANGLFALATVGAPVAEARWSYWAGTAYLGIMGSVVTFPLYFGLIRDIGPGKAAYSSVTTPIVAMALSTLFEGYRWSALAVAGGVVAMAGLVIAMQANPRRARAGRGGGSDVR